MKVVTSYVIPPRILQYFNSALLSMPTVLLRDSSKDLWAIYQYTVKKLIKKVNNLPQKKAICEQLEKEFLELYELIKEKEEELKTKTEHRTQRPFYRFNGSSRNGERIFRRLTFK